MIGGIDEEGECFVSVIIDRDMYTKSRFAIHVLCNCAFY